MTISPETQSNQADILAAAAYEAQELQDWGVDSSLAEQVAALHHGVYGYTEEVDMDEVDQQIADFEKRRINQMISPEEAEIVDRIVEDGGKFGENDIREYVRTVFADVAHDQMALMRAIEARLAQDEVYCDRYPNLSTHPVAVRGFMGGYVRDICAVLGVDSDPILELIDKE